MLVHIVYAHPNPESFTGAVLEAFIAGLVEAGHQHTISDLYAMGFNPLLDGDDYLREARHRIHDPVPADVAAEQRKLDAADAWAFIYPVWWTDAPAILKGWFDRVWTIGWAYNPGTQRQTQTAVVLCTAGNTADELRATNRYQAMETVMLADRIFDRAREKQFHMFDGSEKYPPEAWPAVRENHLAQAKKVGHSLVSLRRT